MVCYDFVHKWVLNVVLQKLDCVYPIKAQKYDGREVLVDSLFPSYVLFLFSHIQNHSHARTVTKSDQKENSKRHVKQRCRLGGAEAAAVAAAPPGLSQLRWQPPNDVEGVFCGVFSEVLEPAGHLEDFFGVEVDIGLVRV